MDFLKKTRVFDFCYGGTPFCELESESNQSEKDNTLTTVYSIADGLTVTVIAKKLGDAYEWVSWFENTSDSPSKIISELWDTNISLPMPHEEPRKNTAYIPDLFDHTVVYAPNGSYWIYDEFHSHADYQLLSNYEGNLFPGTSKKYANSGGRSSDHKAPFFNVYKDGKGYIFAVGWSGQWNCEVSRSEDELTVKTKIEDAEFYLLPHEKIRTSSFVLMPYAGSVEDSHNKWRRLVKQHFSLIGKPGRDSQGPLCACIWGGMTSAEVLERVDALVSNKLPVEYVWMDAGWYGKDTGATPDEFEGDWPIHVGDWQVSPHIHPNGLKDVSKAIHDAELKFLLWVEPERAIKNTPVTVSNPEYFIFPEDPNDNTLLLNLGNEDALKYCIESASKLIEEIGIDCFRQDFNMAPLDYWRKNDEANRKGITEIKHIMGLYRFWDALLERFPHLLIDNCASGGRRIDIETLRRSIPLWRSDYQCTANHPSEGVQSHNVSFSNWMPFSGTGTGRLYDTYRYRSAYAPALTNNYTFTACDKFGDDPSKMKWLRNMLEEYKQVRPYMTEDIYPLSEVTDRKDVWCATQFNRPEEKDGIVLIYRRENSPYETAAYFLRGIDKDGTYAFTDADGGPSAEISGRELIERGFNVAIDKKRTAKVFFYKKI